MKIEVIKVAEADGKCIKCDHYVMDCGCWMNFISLEEYMKLKQADRAEPIRDRERLSEEARKGCDSPITPTKGSEPSRND